MTDRTERLSKSTDAHFAQFYEIYSSSLPIREQKSRAEIEATLDHPSYAVLVMIDDDRVTAFSIVFQSEVAQVALLEYMATDATRRNQGLGATMFAASLKAVGDKPMLVEVDSEREQSPDREMRLRRKNFYRRCGCLQIEGLAYVLPLPGAGAPPLMDLMVHPNGSEASRIPVKLLKSWLNTLYTDVYGQKKNDPRIGKMLRPLGSAARLL